MKRIVSSDSFGGFLVVWFALLCLEGKGEEGSLTARVSDSGGDLCGGFDSRLVKGLAVGYISRLEGGAKIPYARFEGFVKD
jgi:hypothetical protein